MEISKAKIKTYASLAMRKHRVSQGLFMAEGVKCVLETLPFFSLEALVLTPALLQERGVPRGVDERCVYTASPRAMGQLSSFSTPPQMIAVYRLPELDVPSPGHIADELVLALDGVQDPGNMGTIVRIADWFGIADIICSHETVDVFNPKAVQATMGTLARVRVHYTDLPEFIRQSGAPTWGTLLDGQDIYSQPLDSNGLIIMGNEGNGISAQVRPLVTHRLLIPSFPPDRPTTDSLNVAIATSIVCAEFRRRQQ